MSVPADTPNNKSTLLIVAAEQGELQRLQAIFHEDGYKSIVASDATAALRVLRDELCDLVVVDLDLKGVDGLALCRMLRAQPDTSRIPLIVLSTEDRESRKVESFNAG